MTARIHDIPGLLARLTMGNPKKSSALDSVLRGDVEGENLLGQVFKIDPVQENDAPPVPTMTADSILTTQWPEPVWAVPNLLPAGLTILAGAPKIGKSWLALQIAQSVAAGGVVFGERVTQGPVLYLALEDPPRRLKERMQKQGWPVGLPAEFVAIGAFAESIGDLRNGGGEKLARQIESRGYRLVAIDTLSRAVSGDQNDAQEMTKGLAPLQEIAHANNCAVLLNDHHRKTGGVYSDPIADILGSTAKGAMVDTAIGLYRERGKAAATLSVTGREIGERTLALTMDWELGCWQYEGDADALALTERRQEIIEAVKSFGSPTLQELADATGQDKGNTYRRVQDLVNAGLLKKDGKRYTAV